MNKREIELNLLKDLGGQIRQDLIALYPPEAKKLDEAGTLFVLFGPPVLNSYDYGNYRFFSEDFCGACSVASYMLKRAAKTLHKIRLNLVTGGCHTWCETRDGTVIDITYSQFDSEFPIWIGERREEHNYNDNFDEYDCDYVSKAEIVFNSEAEAAISRWIYTQNPFSGYHLDTIQDWLRGLTKRNQQNKAAA